MTSPIQKHITLFLRTDYNCPLAHGKVLDNHKIRASLPTLRYYLDRKCTIILATHLGRPEGKVQSQFRVRPLVEELRRLLPKVTIHEADNCIGKEVRALVHSARPSEIVFLENLRFYTEEEENDPAFAHSLASLADFYVNDAFGVCHRHQASVDAITQFLPSYPGLLLEKEITELRKALHPKRPSIWILGGAKLDKIDLVQQALRKADYILVGGTLALTFLKAKGVPVGYSRVDAESVALARKILTLKHSFKIILPLDFRVAEKIAPRVPNTIVKYDAIPSMQIALDIGPETLALFKRYLRKARTIVWNGPLGYFELSPYAVGTREMGRFIGTLTAVSLCGGGETTEAVHKFHLAHHFTHVSTGGGAALEFLAGKQLPGLLALEQNYARFRSQHSTLKPL